MNNRLLALGIVLLLIGLGASFYYESKFCFCIEYQKTYPYQSIGIAPVVVGGLLVAVGALYTPPKEEITKQNV